MDKEITKWSFSWAWVTILFLFPLPLVTWFGISKLMAMYPTHQEWLEYGRMSALFIWLVVGMLGFIMIPQSAQRGNHEEHR